MATARRFFGFTLISRSERAFTLIEVLLTLAITSILLTLSITSYKDFQENQVVRQAKETLKTNLRLAQSRALGGVKNCGGSSEALTGWFVSFSASSYTLNARCGMTIGSPGIFPVSSGITLTTNINGSSILFQPINKEVVLLNGASISALPSDVVITVQKGTKSQTVTIRKTGDIQ